MKLCFVTFLDSNCQLYDDLGVRTSTVPIETKGSLLHLAFISCPLSSPSPWQRRLVSFIDMYGRQCCRIRHTTLPTKATSNSRN